jgi:methylmalonyl-CoA/ethylmalonyl-CoA epimerase
VDRYIKGGNMATFNVRKVHHLGFVVKDLDETLQVWESVFGIKAEIKENPDLQVRFGSLELGSVKFVFNESTHPESRWAKYLEENGEGLEHVALEIDSIEEAAKAVGEAGCSLRFGHHKPIHGLITNFIDQIQMKAANVELMGPEN